MQAYPNRKDDIMIDYIIIGVVAILLFFAIKKIIKNKKKGSCCGCSGCSEADKCNAQR